jgi:hypothetical protein
MTAGLDGLPGRDRLRTLAAHGAATRPPASTAITQRR